MHIIRGKFKLLHKRQAFQHHSVLVQVLIDARSRNKPSFCGVGAAPQTMAVQPTERDTRRRRQKKSRNYSRKLIPKHRIKSSSLTESEFGASGLVRNRLAMDLKSQLILKIGSEIFICHICQTNKFTSFSVGGKLRICVAQRSTWLSSKLWPLYKWSLIRH